MANQYFRFKKFTVYQELAPFKVGTDGVLIGAWADLQQASHILDIGTGTGLIALMAAQRSSAFITAIEPNILAFRQATQNIEQSIFNERMKVYNLDLQEFSTSNSSKFNHIISNPPYFNNAIPNQSQDLSHARHTTKLDYPTLIQGVDNLLTIDGIFSAILPYPEAEGFIQMAINNRLFPERICRVYPTPDKSANRWLMAFRRFESETEYGDLIIEKYGRHQYSEEYMQLTRDFYLKI